ncbi:MAG: diphthine--ammonia ligase [Bacteroidota bacterium]
MNKRVGCSWSGGKDSCFALMQAARLGYQPCVLVNMMNENGKISRSHGLPLFLLQQQAASMDILLLATPSTWNEYEQHFLSVLKKAGEEQEIGSMVFGDIDLQEHRDWEERVCAKSGLTALLPLWQQNRKELVFQMLDAGIQAMIVSCNTNLGEAFLGRYLEPELILELEEKGVDVCGENGEFHTVVTHCPLFREALALPAYTTVLHNNYWFIQWAQPVQDG